MTYAITLYNNSSADTPDLVCTITDEAIGFSKDVTLASGATDVSSVPWTIPADADDPYLNTASVTCSPTGYPNEYTASDDHSVNLFQPAIDLDKTGDALSKIGDGVTYTITQYNNSSADTPDMVCTISDPTIGFSKAVTLAPGGLHAMLVNLDAPLRAGEMLPLTLRYEHAGELQVEVAVVAADAPPPRAAGR